MKPTAKKDNSALVYGMLICCGGCLACVCGWIGLLFMESYLNHNGPEWMMSLEANEVGISKQCQFALFIARVALIGCATVFGFFAFAAFMAIGESKE